MKIRKIAIIDDEAEMEDIYDIYLAPFKEARLIETIFFADPTIFLKKCSDLKPDLILTDINMPALTGPELCQALRRAGQSVPIYFVSGDGPHDYAGIMENLGVSRFLPKPIEAAQLLKFLQLDLELSVVNS